MYVFCLPKMLYVSFTHYFLAVSGYFCYLSPLPHSLLVVRGFGTVSEVSPEATVHLPGMVKSYGHGRRGHFQNNPETPAHLSPSPCSCRTVHLYCVEPMGNRKYTTCYNITNGNVGQFPLYMPCCLSFHVLLHFLALLPSGHPT